MDAHNVQQLYDYYLQSSQGKFPTTFAATGRGQRGNGIGSFLAGLFRKVFPFIKSGAKAVGRELLTSGFEVVKDNFKGMSLKDSLKKRVREAGGNLTERAATKIDSMVGNGIKRRRKTSKSQLSPGTSTKSTRKRKSKKRKSKKSIKKKQKKRPAKKSRRLKKKVAGKRKKKRITKCFDIFE
jgi:hypothetical protein